MAGEVRNLALRAADAARNTALLIEESVKNIKDGSEIVTITNDDFSGVAVSSSEVGQLIAEISSASREQAEGIEQINKAIAQIDSATQRNAANAQESAAASAEMNVLAQEMRGVINDLARITGVKTHKESRKKRVMSEAAENTLKKHVPFTKRRDFHPPEPIMVSKVNEATEKV